MSFTGASKAMTLQSCDQAVIQGAVSCARLPQQGSCSLRGHLQKPPILLEGGGEQIPGLLHFLTLKTSGKQHRDPEVNKQFTFPVTTTMRHPSWKVSSAHPLSRGMLMQKVWEATGYFQNTNREHPQAGQGERENKSSVKDTTLELTPSSSLKPLATRCSTWS